MLVNKTVSVEQELDAIMANIVSVVVALKAGTPVGTVALNELLQLQQLVTNIKAVPADLSQSLSGSLNAVSLGGIAIAMAAMGKS